jgi:Ca-activated chloride channel family protein
LNDDSSNLIFKSDWVNLTGKGETMTNPLPTLNPTEDPAANDNQRGFGSLSTARGNLPLKQLEVEVRLDGLVSSTIVRQTFVNNLAPAGAAGEALEATYLFPLPDRAAVTRFELRVGERLIEGVLRERGEARREYAAALQQGHRAAIAEEDRSGVFSMCVGNILPGEEARVTLELTGPVPCDDGEATFQFPLVVAPRYVPGAPLSGTPVGEGTEWDTDAVPDASRITPPVLLPGFPNPVELRLVVEVHDAGLALSDFRSSLHAVVEEGPTAGRRITLHAGERLNRDFILRFQVSETSIRTALTATPDVNGRGDGDGGTFQLTIIPPAGLAATGRPRDVVFVLDRSGSMEGWKMVTARRALGRMIDSLGAADRFTVFAFDDRLETPPGFPARQLVPATNRQRFAAIEFLARLESRGGTEIAAPLQAALDALGTDAGDGRERIVALVTDGQVANEDDVLRRLGKRLAGVRVLTLGIDKAVNMGFLQKLAVLGAGYTEVVESEDRLDAVLDRIHRRIATPLLTSLRVELPACRIEAESQTPRRLADLFAGAPFIVRGRYRGAVPTTAQISAVDGLGRPWSDSAAAQLDDSRAIPALWARDQVRALEDEYAVGQSDQTALAARIVECSLRFGVLSRFTAFVAVDRSEVVNAGGECRQIIQPVEAPDGWGMLAGNARHASCFMTCASSEIELDFSGSPSAASRAVGGLARGGSSKLRSWLSRGKKALLASSESARLERVSAGIDLSAYRARAENLLLELRKKLAAGGPVATMEMLAVGLAVLIEDLASVGAPESAVRPLRELLDDVCKIMFAGGDKSQAPGVWQQAEALLEAFASDNSSPQGDSLAADSAPQRQEFWK